MKMQHTAGIRQLNCKNKNGTLAIYDSPVEEGKDEKKCWEKGRKGNFSLWCRVRGSVFISTFQPLLTKSQTYVASQQMNGRTPLTRCRCLALQARSLTRQTTKLAGTNDKANTTQMATSTSTIRLKLKKNDTKRHQCSTVTNLSGLHPKSFELLGNRLLLKELTI